MAKKSPRTKSKVTGRLPKFDEDSLRRLAGDKVFNRGVEYHLGGLVDLRAVGPHRVTSIVEGTKEYHCRLALESDSISGSCTCPAYSDWGFCKHLVATALDVNALTPVKAEQVNGRLGALREHLRKQDKEALIDMIMECADRDSELMRQIKLAAVANDTDKDRLYAGLKEALTDAASVGEYVDYRGAGDWAGGIAAVLERMEPLIERGQGDVVLRLLDHLFDLLPDALESIDDSDGELYSVAISAGELHLKACLATKPESIALARELFERDMDCEWDFFPRACEAYASVLSKAGRAEYRRLAEAAWRKLKPRHAAGRRSDCGDEAQFGTLESILDWFAEQDGDLDARIAIKSKDLSTPFRYLGLAQLCLTHGRKAEALKWAEEGLWLFSKAPDERLVEFAADLYRQTGRGEDRAKLLWQSFERRPSFAAYQKLRETARKGTAETSALTDRCVAWLRGRIEAKPKTNRGDWIGLSTEADVLLEILMSAGHLPEAWTFVRAHPCGSRTMLALAKASERTRPAEAIGAYLELVEQSVAMTGQHGYEEAIRFIQRIGTLRDRLAQNELHARYLADLASRHRMKRNFIKLLQPSSGAGEIRQRAAS